MIEFDEIISVTKTCFAIIKSLNNDGKLIYINEIN